MSNQAKNIEVVANEIRDLLLRKNADYGNSFAKQFEKRGLIGALIRMEDKMSRLDTLLSGQQDSVGESIEDTLADLAGYAILTLVEYRKQKRD